MHGRPPDIIETGWCPRCGYDQRGTLAAGERRCAECGEPYDPAQLPTRPPLGPMGQLSIRIARVVCVIAFVAEVAHGLFVVLPPILACSRCAAPALKALTQLREVHNAAIIYASDEGGAYAEHLASLIPLNYFSPSLVVDPRDVSNGAVTVGTIDLHSYGYTWQEEVALAATIEALHPAAPYYRLGDFWFTRTPWPTGDPDIIFGWALSDDDGNAFVVFDDNQVANVTKGQWSALWRADSNARLLRGWLPVDQPPWLGGG